MEKGSLILKAPHVVATLVYDRTVFLCRPRLIAPRAGLLPFDVTGLPLVPCACASLFVMMSGSVIFPQMRHSHPSYSQAWPPSKCLETLNPPHRSQVIGSFIGGSKHMRSRPPPDHPVHRNSFPAAPLREALHYHPSHKASMATIQANSLWTMRAMTGYIECSFGFGRLVARQARDATSCASRRERFPATRIDPGPYLIDIRTCYAAELS